MTTKREVIRQLWSRPTGASVVIDDIGMDETEETVEEYLRGQGLPVRVEEVDRGFRVELVEE